MNLPEIPVQALCAHDVAAALELGHRAECPLAVDDERVAGQLDGVAVGRVAELDHVDPPRLHGPEIAVLARGTRTVRGRQLLLDRVGERLQRRVAALFDEQRSVRERDEGRSVPVDAGRVDRLR